MDESEPSPAGSRLADAAKIGAYLLLAGGLFLLVRRYDLAALTDPEVLDAQVEALGGWAIAAYMLLWVVLQVALGQTAAPTVAGALVFGWFGGALLALLGIVISTSIHFALVRTLLRGPAQRVLLNKLPWLTRAIEDNGLALLVLLRFLWAPSMLLTMGTAVCGMPFRAHLLALPAMLPQAMVWCLAADSLYRYGIAETPTWRWVTMAAIVAISIGSYLLAVRSRPELRAFSRRG